MSRQIMKALFAFVVAGTLASGCASAYTSVRKNDDGSYIVTRNRNGFVRIAGTVFHCKFEGEVLTCTEIDTP